MFSTPKFQLSFPPKIIMDRSNTYKWPKAFEASLTFNCKKVLDIATEKTECVCVCVCEREREREKQNCPLTLEIALEREREREREHFSIRILPK